MEPYSNDYTKEDDVMLWQLHEIRHTLAEQARSPEQINRHAQEILAQYHLTDLPIIWNRSLKTTTQKAIQQNDVTPSEREPQRTRRQPEKKGERRSHTLRKRHIKRKKTHQERGEKTLQDETIL